MEGKYCPGKMYPNEMTEICGAGYPDDADSVEGNPISGRTVGWRRSGLTKIWAKITEQGPS